jgi:hypothetical protein
MIGDRRAGPNVSARSDGLELPQQTGRPWAPLPKFRHAAADPSRASAMTGFAPDTTVAMGPTGVAPRLSK